MNNKILYGVIAILVILCVSVGLIGVGIVYNREEPVINLNQSGDVYQRENILTVNGEGKISIKPDVAYIQLGARTLNKDAKKAQDENKEIITRVMERLKAMGIQEKDIQTSSYNIWPKYDYQNNKENLVGYQVDNILRVTIREVDKVGEILDAVAQAGVNRTYGISFGVLDVDGAYRKALEKALEDARAKAEIMAKNSGVTLKEPVAVYEGGAPQNVYQYDRQFVQMERKVAMDSAVPISSGELDIRATATIVYRID